MAQLTIQQAFELALRRHQAGRLGDAEQIYRQILKKQPNHLEAIQFFSLLAQQSGQLDMAADLIYRAISLGADSAEAYANLGGILGRAGRFDQAVAACQKAISLNPNLPEAHSNLGNVLRKLGQFEKAVAACQKAIALRPHFSEAFGNLGHALRDMGNLDRAIAAFRDAAALSPNSAEAHYSLGVALYEKELFDGAIAAFSRAVTLQPAYAEAHTNLGAALGELDRVDEAVAAYQQAIACNPTLPETHFNLALALLSRGDFLQGWSEYEWRWKCQDFAPLRRNFSQPLWDGRPLEGRTILIHAEQGLGDSIHCMRYLPSVVARGGRVIVECQAELHQLFQTAYECESAQFIIKGHPLPAFDLHCPFLSLPGVFGTTLENIPNATYLEADPQDVAKWRQKLGAHATLLKVGLVWGGSPLNKNNRRRSMKLASLAPLARTPGIAFFSLQKGAAANELKTPPPGMEIIDPTAELHDFAQTAALIANLDLVITIESAVAQLAGAMGKPVWTLVPFVTDWRWLRKREDSPWYPSMRLFRQTSRGDWDSVIAQVGDALLQHIS